MSSFKNQFKTHANCSDEELLRDKKSIVDVYNSSDFTDVSQKEVDFSSLDCKFLFDENLKTMDVYTIKRHPGLYVIKNPFNSLFHFYYTTKAITQYSQSPYWNNYDPHTYQHNGVTLNGNIWNIQKAILDNNGSSENFQLIGDYLRWSQLGYYFDYNTHIYDITKNVPLTKELNELATFIVKTLKIQNYSDFKPDMALVNYYAGIQYTGSKRNATKLRPHTDTYEQTLDQPIVTISLGLPGVFMIGGDTLNDPYTSLLLRSGDICIMSGQSRTSYHSVPKVICDPDISYISSFYRTTMDALNNDSFQSSSSENNLSYEKLFHSEDIDAWKTFKSYPELFHQYMRHFRINISIRQVML